MEPTLDKDQEPEPTPYGDDLVSGDPVPPEPIPAAAASSRHPWLLQDWIALTVAGFLGFLFLGITWITAKDWPHVMNQLEKAKEELKRIEPMVENPEALKRNLEQAILMKDKKIAELRVEISKLDDERQAQDARDEAATRDKVQIDTELGSAQKAFEKALSSAMSALRSKSDYGKVDFHDLWENGPGDEPDPWGPNKWRVEWHWWNIKSKAHKELRDRIRKPLGALNSAKNNLEKCERAIKTAEYAAKKMESAWQKKIDEITRVQQEKRNAEEALDGPLVEPESWVSEEVRELRKRVKNSEAMKSVLFIQNIPSVFAMLLVTISAWTRLALLRNWFKPRILIHS